MSALAIGDRSPIPVRRPMVWFARCA